MAILNHGNSQSLIADVCPRPVVPQISWGGQILALHLNYVAACTVTRGRGIDQLDGAHTSVDDQMMLVRQNSSL